MASSSSGGSAVHDEIRSQLLRALSTKKTTTASDDPPPAAAMAVFRALSTKKTDAQDPPAAAAVAATVFDGPPPAVSFTAAPLPPPQLRPRAPPQRPPLGPWTSANSVGEAETTSDVDDPRPIRIRQRVRGTRPGADDAAATSTAKGSNGGAEADDVHGGSGSSIQHPEVIVDPVPAPWVRYFDETYQHHYYYNEETGVSQWEPPGSALPADVGSGSGLDHDYDHHERERGRRKEKKRSSPKHADGSTKKNDKGSERKKGSSKKAHCAMPPHMLLLDTSTSSDLGGWAGGAFSDGGHSPLRASAAHPSSSSPSPTHPHPLPASLSPMFCDVNDCYSDMDGDGDSGPYTMPTFDIPEDRLWGENPHGRPRTTPLIGGTNQDYLHMARQYKAERLYSDPRATQLCVLCTKRPATQVLFPCEHRCLCQECMVKEEICADSKMATKAHGHCNCPLCAAVIKKVLPFEHGAEVDKYWAWVYEFPPVLPDKFLKRWKHSAAVIEKVYVTKDVGPADLKKKKKGKAARDDDNGGDDDDDSSESSRSCVVM